MLVESYYVAVRLEADACAFGPRRRQDLERAGTLDFLFNIDDVRAVVFVFRAVVILWGSVEAFKFEVPASYWVFDVLWVMNGFASRYCRRAVNGFRLSVIRRRSITRWHVVFAWFQVGRRRRWWWLCWQIVRGTLGWLCDKKEEGSQVTTTFLNVNCDRILFCQWLDGAGNITGRGDRKQASSARDRRPFEWDQTKFAGNATSPAREPGQ